jgi:hypothetical protein
MSDVTMAEISKGVWVPRGKVILNPEDYACDCMLPKCAECRDAPRPLEPVAAVTYAQAREYAEAAEKARMEAAKYMPPKLAPAPAGEDGYYNQEAMAARGLPRREAGTVWPVAEWNDVPDTTQPLRQAVFNCVKRYRFIKCDDKLIIEVELMSGTTLRHIVKLSQVKGILTKGHARPYAEGLPHGRPEKEVIIDLRAITCPGYAPEQLKFKLSGDENALAFQMALMDAL